MTDIEEKALELINKVREERHYRLWVMISREHPFSFEIEALCRAIEQHEAFKQEVSDIVYAHVNATNETSADAWEKLKTLIIPKPKPDPLVEALVQVDFVPWKELSEHADDLRAALDARGLEIREKDA